MDNNLNTFTTTPFVFKIYIDLSGEIVSPNVLIIQYKKALSQISYMEIFIIQNF